MVRQKYLSNTVMVVFITFMNAFIPLSTDLYLPALPEMGSSLETSELMVSLTLSLFFFVFAFSLVLLGPLTDVFGRKSILVMSSVVYTAASLCCALAPDILVLLCGRFFQAAGSGAIITVATALIKDCFSGAMMTRILAVTQALAVIAPMAAPIIGGILLEFTSWRGSFAALTVLGTINLTLALLYTETLPESQLSRGKVFASVGLLWQLTGQRRFMLLLVVFALLSAPYMAYISVSSFVYIDIYGLSAQEFSYYFAVNSAFSVLGPVIYLRLRRSCSERSITLICFGMALFSTLLVLSAGKSGAVAFLLSFLPFTVAGAVVRPFSMEILLNAVRENTGTASSMIHFVHTVFGSIGLMLGGQPWGNFITGLGVIMLTAVVSAALLWLRAQLSSADRTMR